MRIAWILVLALFPVSSRAEICDWTKSPQPFTRATLVGVAFSSSQSGLVVSQDGLVLRTVNGGKKWAVAHRGSPGWTRIACRGDFVLVAGAGKTAVSPDKGATFHETAIPGGTSLTGADIDGTLGMWVCGMAGKIFHSMDRGETWKDESPERPWPLSFIRTLENGMVLSGGRGGLWIRDNAGKWLNSVFKAGTAVFDADEDPRGATWLLTRRGEHTMVLGCTDISRGCSMMTDDEADIDRLFAGRDNIWLAGSKSVLVRLPYGTGLLQAERMPGYGRVIRSSCEAPGGGLWAVGENGAIFNGTMKVPASR